MAAPKGNKYALGNTWGRPPKYDTPEELAAKIIDYFAYCEESADNITITGLCLYLGFESRSSFDKQAERDNDFSYIVKRAKMVVEQRYEDGLNSPACTGSIFALKNMGWKDKTEVVSDNTHTVKGRIQVVRQPGNEPLNPETNAGTSD